MAVNDSSPFCWRAALHGRHKLRRVALDDAVGVPDDIDARLRRYARRSIVSRWRRPRSRSAARDSRSRCRPRLFAISLSRPAKRPSLSNSRTAPEPDVGVIGELRPCRRTGASAGSGQCSSRYFLTMPSCSMRPNDSAKPPGVQASRLATTKSAASTRTQPSASASRPRPMFARAIRSRRINRSSAAQTSSPSSTARVALWVAADTAISAIKPMRSPRLERLVAQQQEIKRQHAQARKNIGEQDRGQPGQRREQRQRGDDAEQQQRPPRQPMRAQHQRDDPDRERGLQQEHRPERQRRAGIEDEAVDHGAARHQIAFVPARQIAAGVPLQQGKAVPQRGRDEQRDRQYDGKRP